MTERVCTAVDQLLFVPLSAELNRYTAAREHIRELKGR